MKELLSWTLKEQGRDVPPIVVIIKTVHVFFAEIRRSCPGPSGSRVVK